MDELIKERKLPNYTPFEIDNKYKMNQTNIIIKGIKIYFPYNIYPNQITYMEKIIELLNNKMNNTSNGIGGLESPTGTGKTLCLLCSTLAWMNEMRRQKKFGGKILYTTRTHSQITQIINELKKTCYRPKTAILSSRDNSCVNSQIKQKLIGTILNIKCRKVFKNCPYYMGIDPEKRDKFNMMDIEDLCKNGKKLQFCPFYQQIEIAKNFSDIVFMPYNYIFDEDINKIMEIDLENNILIIDEAHNIRKVCEDSKSVEIKSDDFNDIISDFDSLHNYDENQDLIESIINFEKKSKKKKKSPLTEISKDDIYTEKNAIIKIQNRYNNTIINFGKKFSFIDFLYIFIKKEDKNKSNKKNKRIKYRDDELSCDSNTTFNISENINISNLNEHINFLKKFNLVYQDTFEKGSKISILLKIFTIISQLIDKPDLQKSYTFFMENEEKKQYNKETNEIENKEITKKLNIFCFNPEIEFKDILIKQPFSIILTSGTLTPFKMFESELSINFKTTLENSHIVPKEQIKFTIISNYSQYGVYNFDYNNRNNNEMIKALGNEICNYCKQTQYGGILVFFSSYNYLKYCIDIWNEYGINQKILKHKRIYNDSSSNKNNKNQLIEIKKNPNKNYILFSVFRGSSSEGIDFSDDCARVVICVGIPFADKTENRIKLKIEYLDNMKKMEKDNKDIINGNEWYIADAMTAVNQSLGRVIRHINDYGVLVCIDERYKHFEKYFSYWIKEQYKNKRNILSRNVNDFFNEQRKKFKNINQNNNLTFMEIQSNKSGFNNVINSNNIFKYNNNNESNEISSKNIKENENIYEEMDIEDNIDNKQIINHNNNSNINKDNSLQIYEIPQMNEDNINTINVKEIGYKTNHNEILNSLFSDKSLIGNKRKKNSENNVIYEKWDVSRDNKINYIFDKEQKKYMELLESLNEFINNNPKEFNKILNKYK